VFCFCFISALLNCSLLHFVVAHCRRFVAFCCCSLLLLCYTLVVVVSVFVLCSIGVCHCFRAVFYWCLLLSFFCVLLVFIIIPLLCFVGARCHPLVAFC
jgi:hypothetical protein